MGGDGPGRVAMNWGPSSPSSPRRFPSRAGDAGRGRGRGGRGGREEEGVRGRNLPPLAASLSAPGLGTKGGTLMNSLSSPLPGRRGISLSPSRNFAAATFSAVRPGKSVRTPRGLQRGKCPLKVRRSGEEGEWGLLSCLPLSLQLAPLPALRRAEE